MKGSMLTLGLVAFLTASVAAASSASADERARPPSRPVAEALPAAVEVAPPRWEGLHPILCADALAQPPCAPPCAPPCEPPCPPPCDPCCNPWRVDVSLFLWTAG